MATVSFELKDYFFDTEKVAAAISRGERKALSKAGAYVRRSSRSSLRRRKKPSQPGQTPSVHSTHKFRTLKNILFGYDPTIHSVLVGPVGFGSATAPRTLELGGDAQIRIKRVPTGRPRATPKQAASFKRRLAAGLVTGKPRGKKVIQIAARPFMQPALVREAPKFPSFWAGSVK